MKFKNKPTIITVSIVAVVIMAVALFLSLQGSLPEKANARELAAKDDHAGHDHGNEGKRDEMREDLFSDQGDQGHDEHDPAAHVGEPEARQTIHSEDSHIDSQEDEHAGHAHAGGDVSGYDICPEHNVPEAIDALCQADRVGELLPGKGMKVRLASQDVAAKAGIRLTQPQQVTLTDGNSFPGRVIFNREQLAYITSLENGVIRKVHVQPGTKVAKGEVLIDIAMPKIASLKAEFITADARLIQIEAAYLREQNLFERRISSRQEFQLAEAEFQSSKSMVEKYRNQLMDFGLTEANIKTLVQTREATSVVALRAPFAGVVIDLQTAIGEVVSAGTKLVTVADLDSLWLELTIPESRIYQAEVGIDIQAQFNGLPGTTFVGRVFQVGAEVDARTRTLKALTEVQNPDHRLKVGMFGTVQILSGAISQQLMIPADSVQSIDGLPYVFIQDEADLFELRRVETGYNQDGLLVILAGLDLEDQVVSSQGFALKSEVLKARLGASCADH